MRYLELVARALAADSPPGPAEGTQRRDLETHSWAWVQRMGFRTRAGARGGCSTGPYLRFVDASSRHTTSLAQVGSEF